MDAPSLERLRAALPARAECVEVEASMRAILAWLLDRSSSPLERETPDPSLCPNCLLPWPSAKTPYCSESCRAEAAFVRQFRSALADGSILAPERQLGLAQALCHLLGGGYPLRQRLVPPKVAAKVIEREGGVCSVCGGPATEIDHTGSG